MSLTPTSTSVSSSRTTPWSSTSITWSVVQTCGSIARNEDYGSMAITDPLTSPVPSLAPLPKRAPRPPFQARKSVVVDGGMGAVCGLAAKSSPTPPSLPKTKQAPLGASQSAAIAYHLRSHVDLDVEVAFQPRPAHQSPPSHRTPRCHRWLQCLWRALLQRCAPREAFAWLRSLPPALAALTSSHAACEGSRSACERSGALGLDLRSAIHRALCCSTSATRARSPEKSGPLDALHVEGHLMRSLCRLKPACPCRSLAPPCIQAA